MYVAWQHAELLNVKGGDTVTLGCKNPRHQLALVPNTGGSSVWDIHHVTLRVPRIFEVAPLLLANECTRTVITELLKF
jgi:hypothetical protein